jgi:hypothetical protein
MPRTRLTPTSLKEYGIVAALDMRFPSNYAMCEDYFKVPNGRSDTTRALPVARAEGLLVALTGCVGLSVSISVVGG